MSHAWKKLRSAVNKLVQDGSQKERLTAAITDIATLRGKDLPVEIRQEFISTMDRICFGRILEEGATIQFMVDSMKEKDVEATIHSILNMYDAVTRYQPITSTLPAHSKNHEGSHSRH
jgi:hypothetical protein